MAGWVLIAVADEDVPRAHAAIRQVYEDGVLVKGPLLAPVKQGPGRVAMAVRIVDGPRSSVLWDEAAFGRLHEAGLDVCVALGHDRGDELEVHTASRNYATDCGHAHLLSAVLAFDVQAWVDWGEFGTSGPSMPGDEVPLQGADPEWTTPESRSALPLKHDRRAFEVQVARLPTEDEQRRHQEQVQALRDDAGPIPEEVSRRAQQERVDAGQVNQVIERALNQKDLVALRAYLDHPQLSGSLQAQARRLLGVDSGDTVSRLELEKAHKVFDLAADHPRTQSFVELVRSLADGKGRGFVLLRDAALAWYGDPSVDAAACRSSLQAVGGEVSAVWLERLDTGWPAPDRDALLAAEAGGTLTSRQKIDLGLLLMDEDAERAGVLIEDGYFEVSSMSYYREVAMSAMEALGRV